MSCKMKCLVLILATLMWPCLAADVVASVNCKKGSGEDLAVPSAVIDELRRQKLDGYKLIDRVKCKDGKVMWLAIPKSLPSNKPRPLDVELLVTYDMAYKRIEISGLADKK